MHITEPVSRIDPPTEFSLLLQACGLSHAEAAGLLSVRLDTVKSWSAGRRSVPAGAMGTLVDLASRIRHAANQAVDKFAPRTVHASGEVSPIELSPSGDDISANWHGWPCIGAERAWLSQIVAEGMRRGYRFEVSSSTTVSVTDIEDQLPYDVRGVLEIIAAHEIDQFHDAADMRDFVEKAVLSAKQLLARFPRQLENS